MQQYWRSILKKRIEDRYIQKPQEEWYDLGLSASGMLDIMIISDVFVNIPWSQRREQVLELLHESDAPTATGFLKLYTTREASNIAIPRPSVEQESKINNWYDLVDEVMNPPEYPKAQRRKPRTPHTVTFYSFKGGVGRTTALIHAAWILAMRGRKVVVVDLDLEAPGLSALPNQTPVPEHGIVDYFYERSYMPKEIEPSILIGDIVGELHIPNAPGKLFKVSTGSLNFDYIITMDDLRAAALVKRGEDLWSLFLREINEQLQPDVILVDSRAGFSEWGAFSLLRAADQAIIFLYPDEQNKRGIQLLLEALIGTIPLQLVFSPVPLNDAGMKKVKEYWQALQDGLDAVIDQTNSAKDNEIYAAEAQLQLAPPITLPYLTELALASSYPTLPLLPNYVSIADVVDDALPDY